MQNKGAILLFAVLFALVSLYQLSFTLVTSSVKSDAKFAAKGDAAKEAAYLDSVAGKKAYPLLGYTFRECQAREINLGLDLKGGMNVTLEISVIDLVKSLADNSQDPTFQKAIKMAVEKQKNSQKDFVSLFGESFSQIDPNAKLSAIFGTLDLKDRIKYNTSNEEVLKILQKETQDAIDNSFNILRTRIDRFGVVQPNIQKLEGNTGRILVELPGIKEPERVRKLLQGTANLEFWETFDNTEIYPYLLKVNTKLKDIQAGEPDTTVKVADNDTLKKDTASLLNLVAKDSLKKNDKKDLLNLNADSLGTDAKKDAGFAKFAKENPLFAVLTPAAGRDGTVYQGAAIGTAHVKDTAKVNELLKFSQIKDILPKELRLLWDVKPIEGKDKVPTDYFQLIAIKVTDRDGKAALSGDVITNAREQTDPTTGQWEVSMTMDATGSRTWALITKNNIGKQIAIVLDGYVYSYPVVNSEIKGGSSSISGNFSSTEAKDLANILKSGKMPATANIIEEEIVGPSLGQESINSGLISFVIAFILVLIYMVFFYKTAGIVANIALVANVFFIFGVLASLGAVLTMPGIAGIVLTLGMAVDANVIIFERIKEELRAGKGLKLAVSDGYKHAYSAIIDGNVTTLITGIILYIFGHGPIQGFATTLVIGILTSLFSSIFISRIIFTRWLDKNKEIAFFSKFTEHWFLNAKIKFIEYRKYAFVISGIVITAGIISMFTQGFNQGVDFVGGRTYVVKFDKNVNSSEISKSLASQFGDAPEVKTYGKDNQVKIITKFMVGSTEANADSTVEAKLYAGLKPILGEKVTYAKFQSDYKLSSQKVGPTIADDIKIAAVWAILFSLIGIFIYIFIRFKNWQFGLGGIVSLAHDVLFVLGLYSILWKVMPFSLEINQGFIAAILTVIGYSINDTVIIFDRIREYINNRQSGDRLTTYNLAMNSTLGRTFNTSMTTLVVLFAIFLFGGESIQGFIFALLIGIFVGTYSSVFIATPVVYDTYRMQKVKAVEKDRKEYLGGKKKKNEQTETIENA